MELGILERTLGWSLGQGWSVLRAMRSTAAGGRAGRRTGKRGILPNSLAGNASKGSQRCDKNRKAQMNCDARGPMCFAECGGRELQRCSLPTPSCLHPCSCLPSPPPPAFSRLPSLPHLSSPLNIFLSLFHHVPSSCLICSLLSPVAPLTPFSLSSSACLFLSHG